MEFCRYFKWWVTSDDVNKVAEEAYKRLVEATDVFNEIADVVHSFDSGTKRVLPDTLERKIREM